MVTILTLKKGNVYPSSLVNNLFYSIQKHSTVKFKFLCYTDDPVGLDPNIYVEKIKNPDEFPVHWHKLEFHRTGFAGLEYGEDIIIMDIDMIITQNIDDILTYPVNEKEFAAVFRWWSMRTNWCPINGGFQKFKSGATNHIWKKFISMPQYWAKHFSSIGQAEPPYMGEQNLIHHSIEECGLTRKYFPLEWFAKYNPLQPEISEYWDKSVGTGTYFDGKEFNSAIKIVHFSNAKGLQNSVEKHKDLWLKKYLVQL